MQLFLRIFLLCLLFFALLGGCAGARAQSQAPAANANSKPSSAVVEKPVRKSDQRLTDDSIALLAVHHTPAATVASAPADGKSKDGWALDEAGRKAEEIATLEQQIKDKQKRVALLMRLFVDDEKAFLLDPASANADPVVADRRRYEQDELRWETAELGKLKTRLAECRRAAD
ncbi:MAG TPA: hypothetical protein VMU53_00915 [Candidatus Sulfotelmatobacter sp.]|nr:hypothetical protein [Candidatus Sulfotelmatobacter sp.]